MAWIGRLPVRWAQFGDVGAAFGLGQDDAVEIGRGEALRGRSCGDRCASGLIRTHQRGPPSRAPSAFSRSRAACLRSSATLSSRSKMIASASLAMRLRDLLVAVGGDEQPAARRARGSCRLLQEQRASGCIVHTSLVALVDSCGAPR